METYIYKKKKTMHGIRTDKGRQFVSEPVKYGKLSGPNLSNPALVFRRTMYRYSTKNSVCVGTI